MKHAINSGYTDAINTLEHHLVFSYAPLNSLQPYGAISNEHVDNGSFLHICQ